MPHFVLTFDRPTGRILKQTEFPDDDGAEALEERFREERVHRIDRQVEVIVLAGTSVDDLKTTHGRYFPTSSLKDPFEKWGGRPTSTGPILERLEAKLGHLTDEKIREVIVWVNPRVGFGMSASFGAEQQEPEQMADLRLGAAHLGSIDALLNHDESEWLVAHGARRLEDVVSLQDTAMRAADSVQPEFSSRIATKNS